MIEFKEISEKARINLNRNELLGRREWRLDSIPPQSESTIAEFDAEGIKPARYMVASKMVNRK
jgi:hypothetical protein